MKKLFLLLFIVGLSFVLLSRDKRSIVAVMEFTDTTATLSEKMLENASQYMRSSFVGSNQYVVISRERQQNEMVKVMRKESHQMCRAKDCQIPLGQSLSADTILVSTISKFGGKYTLTVELIDLAKEATIRGAKADFDGKEQGLKNAIDDVVSQVFGMRKGTFQEGRIGGEVDSWTPEGGDETIVYFESDPAGAAVLVNGRIICPKTPCSKMLSQGRSEVSMQMENYVPQTKTETVKQGSRIRYVLEPDFGYLTIRGIHNVAVKLDGQSIGDLPVEKRVVSPGPHQVEHTDQCFHPSGEKFTIKRGENRTINLGLNPKESAIKVTARDDKGNDLEADVFVDGKKVGRAPGTFKISLCSKQVVVKAQRDEFKQTLRLEEKKVISVDARLKPSGLHWSRESPREMNWNDAKKYCENLKEDGYSNWRLPTISELRTLIQNCPATETGGACKVANECLSRHKCVSTACNGCSNSSYGRYSKLGDTGWLWSSSVLSEFIRSVWGVNFDNGYVYHRAHSGSTNVRCVRGGAPSEAGAHQRVKIPPG